MHQHDPRPCSANALSLDRSGGRRQNRCLLHASRWPQPQLRDACDRHRRALGALLAFRPALPALTTPDLLSNIYIVAGYVPTGGVINSGIKCRFVSNSPGGRSEEHTSELQSLMRISYAVF